MNNTSAPVVEISLEKMVKAYVKIRARRTEIKAAFDVEDGALVEQLDAVKAALLAHCKDHGVDSVRTSEGLFYRTVKQTYWTCLLYTSPSPQDRTRSRMPSSA